MYFAKHHVSRNTKAWIASQNIPTIASAPYFDDIDRIESGNLYKQTLWTMETIESNLGF